MRGNMVAAGYQTAKYPFMCMVRVHCVRWCCELCFCRMFHRLVHMASRYRRATKYRRQR